MGDDMRYTPAEISVKQGETLRLVIRNKGKLLRRAGAGHARAAAQTRRSDAPAPDMDHGDDPSMVHVKPGKQGEVVWQFTQPGEFQ